MSYTPDSPSWLGSFVPSAVFVLASPSWCSIQTRSSSSTKNLASPKNHCTHSDQPISRLKLFLRLLIVVDQHEPGAPSTTKVCLEAKGNDTSLVGLVEGSELLGEFALGDIRSGGVEDVNNELASGQEAVGDEFARADGYRGVGLTSGSPSVCVDPSNRRLCHPSHSSLFR